jgi:hypothetical protein
VQFGRNQESRSREAAGRRNLARSSAQENARQKKGCRPQSEESVQGEPSYTKGQIPWKTALRVVLRGRILPKFIPVGRKANGKASSRYGAEGKER